MKENESEKAEVFEMKLKVGRYKSMNNLFRVTFKSRLNPCITYVSLGKLSYVSEAACPYLVNDTHCTAFSRIS